MLKRLKYFTVDELRCKCGKCSGGELANGFGEKLDALRQALGLPMGSNSCCRCTAHNKAVGGAENSFHRFDNPARLGTCAIDVPAVVGKDDAYRDKLIELAWAMGWRVGLNNRFVHIDRGPDYTNLPQTIFLYGGYNGKMYPHLKRA